MGIHYEVGRTGNGLRVEPQHLGMENKMVEPRKAPLGRLKGRRGNEYGNEGSRERRRERESEAMSPVDCCGLQRTMSLTSSVVSAVRARDGMMQSKWG